MGTLIVRPTGTVSSAHTKYPSGTAAHNCVNDVSSDGDSTYLQQSVSSTTNTTVDSRLIFSGKLPSKNCTIKKVTVYATAKSYSTYLSGEYDDYDIWIRNTLAIPSFADGRKWTFWQYSDKGELDGYKGEEKYIDMNIFNGTHEEFQNYAKERTDEK